MSSVGTNVHRREGPEKLSGSALYVDDLDLPGCLHGVTVRSAVPCGSVRDIHFDDGFPWNECTIVRARDIPGRNVVVLIEDDQPLLVETAIRHAMEPIVLIAHPERARAYEALRHVHVQATRDVPILTIDDSLDRRRVIYGDDNVMKSLRVERGDVARALAGAHTVVEGTYQVPHQEHVYIENNGMAAWLDDRGRVVVAGSMQCPYYVQKALREVLGRADDGIRVVQTVTGGGFGGKEEYPNMLTGHAALLALASGRPVKMIYDRHEDMQATTKRHPARITHRTGLDRDGVLVAQDIDIVMDAGAYVTLSPVVLSRGILHATGPYDCPNVRANARAVATNTPPNGAFRGFGAPQTLFAAELHWERIAEATGIDAVALRRRNLVSRGSTLATGQVLRDSASAREVLDATLERSAFDERRAAHARWNQSSTNPTWRGIGVAVVHHGSGFTGSGEVVLASRAAVTLTRDGTIRVDAASTEIGQGTISMLAQIAADTLGVPYEWVEVAQPDTAAVPDSGPTVASRTCMVVGGLVKRACTELRGAIENGSGMPGTREALAVAAARLLGDAPERSFLATYEKPADISWDESTYRGDAYAAYAYAAVAVDLEIDRSTYEVKLHRLTTAHEVGRAINPLFVEGQIMGGVTQALGWALFENPILSDGVMANTALTTYIVPTAMDTPPLDVLVLELPYERGPFGAKGIGEIPMDVAAPAVAAAVKQATGVLFDTLPIVPERIAEKVNGHAHDQR